jgi:hypothetical protein
MTARRRRDRSANGSGSLKHMDRQTTLLVALGLLVAAAAFVSVSGWILFVRDRRATRATGAEQQPELIEGR